MSIKIFFHKEDLDGESSGALANYYYVNEKKQKPILYPISYEDKFPWKDIRKTDIVVMVDFAIQPNKEMKKLNEMTNLIWIDHHKTAIDTVNKITKINGIQNTNFAGCELTWKYFYKNIRMPKWVNYLGRYDIYDQSDMKKWNTEILPFQFGMKSYITNPTKKDCVFYTYLQSTPDIEVYEYIIRVGKRIRQYQINIDESYMGGLAYPVKFEEFNCIAANYHGNSQSFQSVWDETKYDIMIMYIQTKNKGYTISLYSTKKDIDCGKIAKKYKGGGHSGAAGFSSATLPWLDVKGNGWV